MTQTAPPSSPRLSLAVLAGAAAIALVSARPFAGAWNDGSRLATVEALVDHCTLAIDDSIFVKVPPRPDGGRPAPYPEDDPLLMGRGTGDKLFIKGHYYSDKSPVPALAMAEVYQAGQVITGVKARERADLFCYWLTVVTSGLAYVVAVWCLYRSGVLLGLPLNLNLALTASLAMATVALTYARHVNNHILLLGVTAAILLQLLKLAQPGGNQGEGRPTNTPARAPRHLLFWLGTLAGLGYTIDLGAGPVLLICTLGVILYRCRPRRRVVVFLLAAAPWLMVHHAVNYATGGTWKPANAVPEYFLWPGCSFNPQNMTGAWNHPGIGHFLTYAFELLGGKKGFLGHNPALFLALPALVILLFRRIPELPEVVFAGFCCGGIWLAYALTSNNYSGVCCSVRWFVPLLAPGYFALAVFLREFPRYRGDFLILSCWGAVIAGLAWWHGPWMKHMVPYYWPLQGAALASWGTYRFWRFRARTVAPLAPPRPLARRAEAA